MPIALIIATSLGLLIFIAAAAAAIAAPRLGSAARIVTVMPLALVTLLSIYGLLTTREPGNSPLWTVLYLGVFAACVIAIARLALAKRALPERTSQPSR